MKIESKEKLTVYALAMIFFVIGVLAVFKWLGTQREVGLVVSFVGLGALAVIQSVKILKKNKNR